MIRSVSVSATGSALKSGTALTTLVLKPQWRVYRSISGLAGGRYRTRPDKFELARALRKWLPHLKGTTVFPDLSRPQSPYERIPDGVYEVIEGVMGANAETGQAFDDCASGACPVR